jgi:saccharopine dehydrogenase-like NADP-dependent oxidoreductase
MFDFAVFGATGMQGRIVSRDLLESGYSVLLCGRDKKRLEKILKKYKNVAFEYLEMSDTKRAAKILKKNKISVVANCIEADWNLHAMEACVAAGAHYVDLGSEIWMTKKQFAMHDNLKRGGLTCITGCGSVPGIGNVMLNYAAKKFDRLRSVDLGFAWNSNIKKFVVPFSMQSIIEEFTDPAPVIEKGKFVNKMPMASIIDSYHNKIGDQKEFLVRHPETYTFFRYFKDKGLNNIRFFAGFPPHSFQTIKTFIDCGLGSKKPMQFKKAEVAPVTFLSEVLKDLEFPAGYKEKENLWVKIRGYKSGKKKTVLMECIVPTLDGWEDAGCNIDTGMPASIMAQMIKTGAIKERGSFAPEKIIPPEPFFKELRKRKMIIFENGKKIN